MFRVRVARDRHVVCANTNCGTITPLGRSACPFIGLAVLFLQLGKIYVGWIVHHAYCSQVRTPSPQKRIVPSGGSGSAAQAERRRSIAEAKAAVGRREASALPLPNPPPHAGEGKERKDARPH